MSRPSRQYIAHAKRERVLDAVAQLNAEHGYAALTPAAIAARAELTQGAFRAQYTGVEDAFAAAMELGHMKGQSIVERARASTLDWNAGVSDAIAALLEFLASEPYFARLAFVDAPLVGAELASRTIEHVEAYARLLLHGAPRRHRPATIAQDAIAHALFELVYRHAAADRIAELPRVTALARYLALAPFLGVSEAAEALPV